MRLRSSALLVWCLLLVVLIPAGVAAYTVDLRFDLHREVPKLREGGGFEYLGVAVGDGADTTGMIIRTELLPPGQRAVDCEVLWEEWEEVEDRELLAEDHADDRGVAADTLVLTRVEAEGRRRVAVARA